MGNKKIAVKVENISIRFNLSKEKVDNLKELTKKLANIKTGITIPFIRPYFEIAKE